MGPFKFGVFVVAIVIISVVSNRLIAQGLRDMRPPSISSEVREQTSAILNKLKIDQNENRKNLTELDNGIVEIGKQVCDLYRTIWRGRTRIGHFESDPLTSPYNKPEPLNEAGCRKYLN